MPGREVEAFILQVRPFGEADLLADFFTLEAGRMRGIAKGAKKSKRRFVHCLETLNRVRLTLFEKQNVALARIDQGELIDPFPGIRKDFRKWGQASYCCEMTKELFAVGDCNGPVFTLLEASLKALELEKGEQNITTIFQVRLLHLAGYALYLKDCLGCGKKVEAIAGPLFSLSRGGVFCAACLRGDKGLHLSQGSIRSLRQAMAMKLPEVFRLRFGREIQAEIDGLLGIFSTRVMGKELGSTRYLRQIQEPYG